MKRKKSEKRKATHRMMIRFLPEQMDTLRRAVSKCESPWRGMSWHCRNALMVWAGAMLSPVADARMRPVGKVRPRKPATVKAAV